MRRITPLSLISDNSYMKIYFSKLKHNSIEESANSANSDNWANSTCPCCWYIGGAAHDGSAMMALHGLTSNVRPIIGVCDLIVRSNVNRMQSFRKFSLIEWLQWLQISSLDAFCFNSNRRLSRFGVRLITGLVVIAGEKFEWLPLFSDNQVQWEAYSHDICKSKYNNVFSGIISFNECTTEPEFDVWAKLENCDLTSLSGDMTPSEARTPQSAHHKSAHHRQSTGKGQPFGSIDSNRCQFEWNSNALQKCIIETLDDRNNNRCLSARTTVSDIRFVRR